MSKTGELFGTFFKIGAFTFGGGYAMVALLEHEFVEEKRWLTREGLNAFKGIGYHRQLQKAVEEERNKVDDCKGRQAHRQSGGRRTGDTGQLIADVGSAVV